VNRDERRVINMALVLKASERSRRKDMIICEPTACMRVIMDARHSKAFSSNQSPIT